MPRHELTLMLEDYHRTHALHAGTVAVDGLNLKTVPPAQRGEACNRPVYERYDVAEMSFSWYLMARCRNEPVIALPIFPLRMFVQPYIFCSQNSKIRDPVDLKGKRVAIQQYRMTVGLWSRGILQEHYGIAPDDMLWVTSEPEEAGFVAPHGVQIEVVADTPEDALLSGQADALIAFNVPKAFREGDPRMRRVFGNCREAILSYFRETGIFPMTHTLVLREAVAKSRPGISQKLVAAFYKANEQCRLSYDYPKRLSYPTAVLLMEEEAVFGSNPWEHGLRFNEAALRKFIEYAHTQNYISTRPEPRDVFLSEY